MAPRRSLDRYLPVAYFGLAVVLTAAILPTALRPPPQAPPTSAQLSPDSPPESNEVLLTELGRGSTTTAGATAAGAIAGEGPAIEVPKPNPQPRKGRCFGDPPRQVESLYAPPCVPAFVGDNGGATWRGVTRDEVRWGLVHARSGSGYEGPVSKAPDGDETARSWRVWEEYFNKNFELYGRTLRLFIVRGGAEGWREGTMPRSAVQKLDDEYKVMGLTTLASSPAGFEESLRRGLMFFGYGWGSYERNDPLQWEFQMDRARSVRMEAELICKQLHGRPVSFAGDAQLHGRERKIGLISYADPNFNRDYGVVAEEELRKQCGWGVSSRQNYNLDDDVSGLSTVMTKFRADGVTTIMYLGDSFSLITFTQSATSQRYSPEWVHFGRGGMDRNATAAAYSGEQWRNAIGISAFEMNGARPSGEDWYRAYKEIDPEGTPGTPDFEASPWYAVLHVVGSMQMAGPKLTPHTIKEGLLKRWPPRPPEPNWTIAGGYSQGDWTYAKYVQLLWWDPAIARPDSTSQGAYRYLYNGRRFTEGELPPEPAPFFKEGITRPPDEQRL